MNEFILKELRSTILGDTLGEGAFRSVYEHKQRSDLVVKVEEGGRSFCNVLEWEVWHALCKTKTAKWLAPVEFISSAGSILLMKKVTPLLQDTRLPKKVPAFLGDLHRRNWGVYEGRIVCCDYGNIHLRTLSTELTIASWAF